MSRFSKEISIISRTAWIIALLAYACLASVLWFGPMRHEDPEFRNWPDVAKLAFAFVLPLFLSVFILLVGYVNADAKRRGMRHVMWTLLALFVPNAIGIIMYFILRDPLLVPCRQCGATAKKGFAFCPSCGTAIKRACPQCRHAVEPGWTHCAYCGTSLSGTP